jgi:hypothetical protein
MSLMFGAIQTLHLIFQQHPPPQPQNDQNVTVMQQASACQVHIPYRQRHILKCTTELPLKQAHCSCMHKITTQTTASFRHMVLLILSRSHQISEHTQILNKQHTISLCNVTNLCYVVLLIYSVPQELDITYNQHTVKAFVNHKFGATYFSCITHISSALCVSIGQPRIV